jgi:DNA-directed RNA polymerase specialized sigma24 family protein
VQDAMLRAFSYFGSYKGGDGRSWLLRIVRNVAYGTLAARRRHGTMGIDLYVWPESGHLDPGTTEGSCTATTMSAGVRTGWHAGPYRISRPMAWKTSPA